MPLLLRRLFIMWCHRCHLPNKRAVVLWNYHHFCLNKQKKLSMRCTRGGAENSQAEFSKYFAMTPASLLSAFIPKRTLTMTMPTICYFISNAVIDITSFASFYVSHSDCFFSRANWFAHARQLGIRWFTPRAAAASYASIAIRRLDAHWWLISGTLLRRALLTFSISFSRISLSMMLAHMPMHSHVILPRSPGLVSSLFSAARLL